MPREIKVDTITLPDKAKQLRACNQTQQEILHNLRNLLLSLGDDWKGEAASAFGEQALNMILIYKGFINTMNDYADLMDDVVRDFKQLDEETKSKLFKYEVCY